MERRKETETLKQKVKTLKQQTAQPTFIGKVVHGVSSFGESLTRPAKIDPATGKVIPGTGGIGAKIMQYASKPSEKKPATATQPKQPMNFSALDEFFGGKPQTMPSAPMMPMAPMAPMVTRRARVYSKVRRKGRKKTGKARRTTRARYPRYVMQQPASAQPKPFDINDVLNSLPQ